MDGTGLTALAEAHKTLAAEGGELTLVRCRSAVARLLHLSGFHHLFAIEERPVRVPFMAAVGRGMTPSCLPFQ